MEQDNLLPLGIKNYHIDKISSVMVITLTERQITLTSILALMRIQEKENVSNMYFYFGEELVFKIIKDY